MKVRYNSAALADLDEIFAYIAADNQSAAAELVEHLQHVVALIGLNPQMGNRTKRPNLKKFPIDEHLIV
jgi:plasmid stabilization system protein ParE